MKFKCTSCRHEFEHETDRNECFCPECGSTSTLCAEEESTVFCSECGARIPSGATACPSCGCPVSASQKQFCQECGAELTGNARVCPQCGCPVTPDEPPMVSPFPAVNITQTNELPVETEEEDFSVLENSKGLYWWIGGIILFLFLISAIFYAANKPSRYKTDKYESVESVEAEPRFVVVDCDRLRMRYAPSWDSDTYRWSTGTERYLTEGQSVPYKGKIGDFYIIEYEGQTLYVSRQYTHLE